MLENIDPKPGGQESEDGDRRQATGEFESLRRIITGPEQSDIKRLADQIEDPQAFAHHVSEVLPEAILLRSSRDRKIGNALEPAINQAITASIRRDRKALVDALFPVMGPAIRKAVSSAFLGMIQSFNQILEHSISFQGLLWRLEALRTRRPFGEVVLMHKLLFQAEQVFLIHTASGLLLQHVFIKEVNPEDPDLVSGMLTAIQDFVQDSFAVEKEDGLDTLRVGSERSIWIEYGNNAYLAAVMRGTPPLDYRSALRDALDTIHLLKKDELNAFGGQTEAFDDIRGLLSDCLQIQVKEENKRKSPILLWAVAGLLAVLFLSWVSVFWRAGKQWDAYITELRRTPGIIVTEAERRFSSFYVSGLRDPLAGNPDDMLAQTRLDPEKVTASWKLHQSLEPELVLQRSKQVLNPPETVTLTFSEGELIAGGAADHQWIAEARKLAPVIPGVFALRASNLVDRDQENFEQIAAEISLQSIVFINASLSLNPDQIEQLKTVAGLGRQLQRLALLLNHPLHIEILPESGSDGFEHASTRAVQVQRYLLFHGLSPSLITIGEFKPSANRQSLASVSFRVVGASL